MNAHTGRNAAALVVSLLLLASPVFAVNLVTNPSFAGNTAGWNLNPSTTYDATNDATGVPGSGSAKLPFAASGASTTVAVDQCIATGPGTYTFGGKILIPSGQSVGGSGIITVSFFSGGNCSTGLLFFDSVSTSVTGSFQTLSKSTVAPPGTTNAWITGQNSAAGAGTHTVNYDDFVFDNGVAASADLAVTKSGPATVTAGNNITYNITVTNNGPNSAQSVTLTDTLPAGTTFVSEAQNTGPSFSCANPAVGASGTVSCTLATLTSGASATFSIVDKVSVATPGGTTITNTGTVSSTTADPTPGNNSASASATASGGNVDLSITKTPSPPPYGAGLPISYTMSVSNAGPAPAASVVVTDTIPAGSTFVSATPSQGSCSGTTTVTCTLGTIASGGSASVSLVVNLPSTPGLVSNTASVTSSNPDTNPANNAATATVTVIPAAQIPALSPLMMLLLAATLSILAAIRLRG